MRVVAVIPAYNEAKRIAAVVGRTMKLVDHVVVANDGSTDETALAALHAGATVVSHALNCGAGAATMTGIDAARALGADVIVTLDADEQHDPQDIPSLLQPIVADCADIVFANRFGQKNRIPLIRRFFNAVGNLVTFATTGRWVNDSQCGFKVFGPLAVRQVAIRMSGYEFCSEIVREAVQRKWRIAEVPIKVLYSQYTLAKGQSFANGVRTALKILLRSFLR